MLGNLGRRLVDLVVLLFAVLGFIYVPLGRRTGLEHIRAIFSTPAAEQAGREFEGAVRDLGAKWRSPSGPESARPRFKSSADATGLAAARPSSPDALMCRVPGPASGLPSPPAR